MNKLHKALAGKDAEAPKPQGPKKANDAAFGEGMRKHMGKPVTKDINKAIDSQPLDRPAPGPYETSGR